MTAQTITAAVAKRDESPEAPKDDGPGAMIRSYRADLAQVMPTHVRPDVFVRVATGVVRRDPKLQQAANNSPTSLMVALMDAARLGLEPGTEQYYLTPRKNKQGRFEVLGIPGYQGYIELMYRSGAVASVVVEVVRANDKFSYRPGRDTVPEHDIDWMSADRGELVLVYAYARMTGGATSKVVVLNRDHIAKAKESSQGANSSYSPWQNHEEAMWLKTAARRLSKWVPTSTEDRRIVQGIAERADRTSLTAADIEPDPLDITELTAEIGEPIDGELVDDDAN
ncbi:recombinase RecT [Saccharopolyspora shandongensis]|uniref:recombinase RecT n=1 Tax=Saccharopolyspora shandongensis TaxID=418495 RepID=UPI003414D10E